MADRRSGGPYIWVTWLSDLLAGTKSCEAAAWFRAWHYANSWTRAEDNFDLTQWSIEHTALLNAEADRARAQGLDVSIENQNEFVIQGSRAAIAGRPDIVTVDGERVTVIDVKTGQRWAAHDAQVKIYMWATAKKYVGKEVSGRVVYRDRASIPIQAAAVDTDFARHLTALVERIAADEPPPYVPSARECSQCPITSEDCDVRAAPDSVEVFETDEF